MQRLVPALSLAIVTLALAGCSTVDDVIAYGKGPFDHGPIPRSETALEGLHESSWGNSGKWGQSEAEPGDEAEKREAVEGEGAPQTTPQTTPQ